MASGWYNSGVVAVTNGVTTVTGTSTAWVDNGIEPGMGFQTDDGRTYAISSVNSNTSLTLEKAYLGTTGSGKSYDIIPLRGNIKLLTDRVNEMLTSVDVVVDGYGVGKAPDGLAATPSYTFLSDQDTGMYRSGTNALAFAVNGTMKAQVATSGLSVNGGLTVTDTNFPILSLVKSGVGIWYVGGNGTANTFNIQLNSGPPAITIDTGGNLGIGTTAPAVRLHAASAASGAVVHSMILENTGAGASTQAKMTFRAASGDYAGIIGGYGPSSPQITYNVENGIQVWTNAGSEVMKLNAAGDLLVATADPGIGAGKLRVSAGGTVGAVIKNSTSSSSTLLLWNADTTDSNFFQEFYTETAATARGSVVYNRGAGLVAFNTTSDYRVKDEIGPIDAEMLGDQFQALRPFVGKMHGATQERTMFFAHEIQEIFPYAVTGEKDAVDDDGNPVLQMVDYSALVPELIAQIKFLTDRVENLESLLAAQ